MKCNGCPCWGVVMTLLMAVGLLVLLIFVARSNNNKSKEIFFQNMQINRLEDSLKSINNKQSKLKAIEKSLIIKYGIPSYEARHYAIIYDEFSTKYNISWEVYPCMIWVESRFLPMLISDHDAVGIAQVKESTAKSVCKQLNITYNKHILFNSITCHVIGLTYLSDMINKNGINDGLRSYIGGPSFKKGCNEIESYVDAIKKESMILHYIYVGVSKGDTTMIFTNTLK